MEITRTMLVHPPAIIPIALLRHHPSEILLLSLLSLLLLLLLIIFMAQHDMVIFLILTVFIRMR
jgi:hypothetical protein